MTMELVRMLGSRVRTVLKEMTNPVMPYAAQYQTFLIIIYTETPIKACMHHQRTSSSYKKKKKHQQVESVQYLHDL